MDNCGSVYQEVLQGLLQDKLSIDSPGDQGEVNSIPLILSNNTTQTNLPVSSRENRAAVLICIFCGQDGELRVILNRRSMKLSSHPGDVALPGGKMDEGDADDTATALREAMEEIGLEPSLVRVVANLEPFISSNLLRVVPVIAILPRVDDFKPVLNEDEVDAIFDAPLAMFLEEDGRYRCIEKEWGGWKYACHIFDIETEQGNFMVGGLTASILIQAATIIYKRSPSFDQTLRDFSQLQWALSTVK
ncbi:nudix hydrolase 15, mitochondrial-like [Andrographis paniculata]|uniref:nudix hydrolase 15, mitochondrial-like n=1 Tax=Andrographis paniculata TaxID=175694 RepID=UPI0021E706BF|nr:nudix hydrolase 15, mitochondrial-like [Andrographis paniculata]